MDYRTSPSSRAAFPASSDSQWCPGARVEVSGLYEATHVDGQRHPVVFLRTQDFPACACCGKKIVYRLLCAAPYILEDEDFGGCAQYRDLWRFVGARLGLTPETA